MFSPGKAECYLGLHDKEVDLGEVVHRLGTEPIPFMKRPIPPQSAAFVGNDINLERPIISVESGCVVQGFQ